MSAFTASYQKYTLVFKKPAMTSRGALLTRDVYFLRLRTPPSIPPNRGEALLGLGECGPLPGLSVDDRPDFEAKVAEVCRDLNRGCPPDDLELTGFPALAFGLEMALLDWRGGGQRRLYHNPFSRGQASLPTHGLVWMADPAGLRHQIEQKVAQGFTCLKLKVGALDFETECRLLANVRRTYPADRIQLRLDANGAFTPENALERLTALAAFDIFALEQPLKPGQPTALAEVCRHSPIPIALDEALIGVSSRADKAALLQTIRPHYLVLKPSLIGGFAAAEAWIHLAESLGIGWWVNSMLESNIGLNAIYQWVGSLGVTLTQGLGTGQLYTNNIPAPLGLVGAGLRYDPGGAWDVSAIDGSPPGRSTDG